MRQMAVNLAGVELKNPVMTASGTFGSGAEYGEMVDLNKLGAVVTKGVANVPWPGNPTPRIAEVYGWRSTFPARTSRRAASHLDRIRKQWRRSPAR